jgi:hypothetical protein
MAEDEVQPEEAAHLRRATQVVWPLTNTKEMTKQAQLPMEPAVNGAVGTAAASAVEPTAADRVAATADY